MYVRHELTEGDFIRKVNRQFANPRLLTNLVVGDEAAFALNVTVNALNVGGFKMVHQPIF